MRDAPSAQLGWRRLTLALSPGVAFMTAFIWRSANNSAGSRRFTLFDDAMISMTYARTFADTGELVWYPGADRIQGITNPFWTAVMAALHFVGLSGSAAALAVAVIGALLIIASALLTASIVGAVLGNRPHASLISSVAAGTVALLYPLVFWTLRGMEVGLLATLLLLIVRLTVAHAVERPFRGRDAALVSLVCLVGVWTRLDFVLPALAVVALRGWFDRSNRRALGVAVTTAAAVGAGALSVLGWQKLYYGSFLPNTYTLKVEGFSAFDRIPRGLVSTGKVLPLIAILVVVAAPARRLTDIVARRVVMSSVGTFFVLVASAIWVGGDAWESYLLFSRYVSVGLPLVVVAVFVAAGARSGPDGSPEAIAEPPTMRLVAIPVIAAVGAGLVSNPYRFHWGYAIGMATVMAVSGALAVLAHRRASLSGDVQSEAIRNIVVAIVLLAAVGAYPAARWALSGGLHIADDQQKTSEGRALAEVTMPQATIATVWAGSPGYYADRNMVDLLGKSDMHVADAEPTGDFYPGHNKFDFDFSIGELRPDVVFNSWPTTDPLNAQLSNEWGYRLQCADLEGITLRSWFLVGSDAVRWEQLSDCDE